MLEAIRLKAKVLNLAVENEREAIFVVSLERNILGAILSDSNLGERLDELSLDLFIDTTYKQILQGFKELRQKKKPIDVVSAYEVLRHKGITTSTLTSLVEHTFTTAYFDQHIETLKERASKRKLYEAVKDISETIVGDLREKETIEVKSDILKKVNEVIPLGGNSENIPMIDVIADTITHIEDKYNNRDDVSNQTGIIDLDRLTGGLHPGELTILASRPSVGKTALALQIATHFSTSGKNVLFFSREMRSSLLGARLVSKYSGVDGNIVRTGQLKEEHFEKILNASGSISNLPMWINETASTMQEIRAAIRHQQPIHRADLVVIDYLQLLRIKTSGRSREQEVAGMSRDAKLLSGEYNIPVIMLSQLNRNAEGRRPNLGDLRESGALEQDADNVLFLHPCSYDEVLEKGFSHIPGQTWIELSLSKQRSGPTGIVDLIYIPSLLTFKNVEQRAAPSAVKACEEIFRRDING